VQRRMVHAAAPARPRRRPALSAVGQGFPACYWSFYIDAPIVSAFALIS
jgi:hypothetical protein